MKHGKKYNEIAKLVDRTVAYEPEEAIALVKKTAAAKFDETVEVHIKTGCDGRDRLGDVHGDGAGLGVGHQALGTQNLTKASYHAHHVGGGHHYVEVQPAFLLNLGDELLAACEVRACGLGLRQLVALCEYQHPDPVRSSTGWTRPTSCMCP